ncbi:MAG: pantoate--beta-alanine ligase [Acidobacteriota bacterium]
MIVVESLEDLRRARRSLAGALGLVPTMGALHEGHLSLIRRARAECDAVAASIFVNPAQFGPHEDLQRYPRQPERDLELLRSARTDLVWLPAPEIVYPAAYQTYVSVEHLSQPLEGEARPGHFRGVATVVAKLFNTFQPQRAYFGQKDAQQATVIRRMSADLDFPVEVVVCPTVREPDGLAMSSRNAYLPPEERQAAAVLYRALCAARAAFEQGERSGERLRAVMSGVIAGESLARVEYVSAADPENLRELETVRHAALLSTAVRIGETRLIDNLLLPGPPEPQPSWHRPLQSEPRS